MTASQPRIAMHRICVFFIWICTSIAAQEIPIFEEEPASSVVRLGDRVRLRCKINSPADDVAWYFNGARLITSATARPHRKKRNREDRSSVNSFTVLSDDDFEEDLFSNTRRFNGWPTDANHKRRRRRKDGTQRGRRRKSDDYVDKLPTARRYVRSAEDTTDIESLGIEIRPERLLIASVAMRNAGEYYCAVTTHSGALRSKAGKVEIAEIRNFTYLPPKSMSAYQGEAVVIPCELPHSVPAAEAKWKLNDVEWLEDGAGPYTVLRTGSLLIRNTAGLSGARFRCAAYNPTTKETKQASAPTELTVKDPPSDAITSRIIYPVSNMTEVTSRAGEKITLQCIFNVPPSRNNGTSGTVSEIRAPGKTFKASPSDSGSFTCADSPVEKTYKLNVIDKPTVRKVSPSAIMLEDGSGDFVPKCTLTSLAPVRWSWYKNGVNIPAATSDTLPSSQKLSAGLYQCFAENQAGSDYALIHVTERKESVPVFTTSDEYFNATVDNVGIKRPVFTGSRGPEEPTTYELAWTSNNDRTKIKLYSIKYYKTPEFADNGSAIRYESKIVNVPGIRNEVTLTGLQPSNTYVVEMVAVDHTGSRSELQISSFRTGEEKRSPVVPDSPGSVNRDSSPERPSSPRGKPGRGRRKVPRAPLAPTVTRISAHKISLMWRPRGNGGSPIQGYRVERKRVDEKDGWSIIADFISTESVPYEIADIQRGALYKFRVIAVNAAGDSKASQASNAYPEEVTPELLLLEHPPHIIDTTTQGDTDIVIKWKYDVPESSIGGYVVYYRSSDDDDEEDYQQEKVTDPSATSHVIRYLQPEMQYDIKIQAFNARGKSPYSNVMIIEMPKLGGAGSVTIVRTAPPKPIEIDENSPPGDDYNEEARARSYQRNAMFLITGAVIAVILLILLVTVFCYWKRRGTQNAAESTPDLKQRNGYIAGKPNNHINMAKLDSNGRHTPNNSASHTPSQYNASPHDTRCQCSRHHSNHSSLGRDGMDYTAYPMPPYNGDPGHPGFVDYRSAGHPRLYSNPMRMYMDSRHPCFPHPLGRGMAIPGAPPIWWMRGENGEFCHIVPSDTRKMSAAADEAVEIPGGYPGGGGVMMMRTYDGNVTSGFYGDDTVHRPDPGYHSNEDGTRTSSDSQAEDSARHQDDESNSTGGATSGVVTLNDVTIESRPSSKMSSAKNSESERMGEVPEAPEEGTPLVGGDGSESPADVSDDVIQKTPRKCEDTSEGVEPNSDNLEENITFLHNDRKETFIT